MKAGKGTNSSDFHKFPGLGVEQFIDNISVHIGQPPIYAIVPKGELCVIDAEQVQYRCVYVIAVSRMDRRFVGPLVALAVSHAALDAAPRQPGGESEWIMIAAFGALTARHSTEFRRPNHDR